MQLFYTLLPGEIQYKKKNQLFCTLPNVEIQYQAAILYHRYGRNSILTSFHAGEQSWQPSRFPSVFSAKLTLWPWPLQSSSCSPWM